MNEPTENYESLTKVEQIRGQIADLAVSMKKAKAIYGAANPPDFSGPSYEQRQQAEEE